jgi:hypothetical protein
MDKFLLGALFVLWCMLLAKGSWVAVGLGIITIIQTARLIDVLEKIN